MTTAIATLEPLAREMIAQEWRRLHRELDWRTTHCVLTEAPLHLIPDLLRLLDDHHEVPVRDLAPTIRMVLSDAHFSQNGDRIAGDLSAELDRQTAIVICVLEKVRDKAMTEGHWSDAPMSTIWFG